MLFKSNKRVKAQAQEMPINDDISIADPQLINFLHPDDYTSADKALQNSDLYSTIYQISADIATSKFTADMPRAQSLLDNPSSTSNAHAFWQSMAAQLLLDGNAYAYIWRNVNGVPVRLEYLRPSQVSAFLLDDGSGLVYSLQFDEPDVGVMEAVPQSDMIHFRLLSTNGGMTGHSPLMALQDELQIKASSNSLTISALGHAITPNGVLTVQHGGLLSDKDKVALSNAFEKQATSASGPVVLDDLSTYQPLEIRSDVSSLLSSTDWTSKQIAKVYGIPDSYLNGQGDQQSSLTMISGMYSNALNRYLTAEQSELDNKLTADISVSVQPALDPDNSDYANQVGAALKNGAITSEQANWMLKQSGFIPADAPDYKAPPAPVQQVIAQAAPQAPAPKSEPEPDSDTPDSEADDSTDSDADSDEPMKGGDDDDSND